MYFIILREVRNNIMGEQIKRSHAAYENSKITAIFRYLQFP